MMQPTDDSAVASTKRAKRTAKKAKKGGAIQEYGKHGVLNETE